MLNWLFVGPTSLTSLFTTVYRLLQHNVAQKRKVFAKSVRQTLFFARKRPVFSGFHASVAQ